MKLRSLSTIEAHISPEPPPIKRERCLSGQSHLVQLPDVPAGTPSMRLRFVHKLLSGLLNRMPTHLFLGPERKTTTRNRRPSQLDRSKHKWYGKNRSNPHVQLISRQCPRLSAFTVEQCSTSDYEPPLHSSYSDPAHRTAYPN